MMTQPGGGGGGAVTIADGADVTEGSIADAAVTGNNPGTVNAHLRGITTQLAGGLPASLGQKTMAGSLAVVIASDQTAFPVTVTGTVTANQGTSPWVENVSQFGGANVVTGVGASGAGIPRVTLSNDSVIASITSIPQLPAALVGGRLDTNIGAWLGSTAPTVGSKTSANSVPVVIASDQGAVAENLTQVGGAAITLGQKTMANSVPVVLASDQSTPLPALAEARAATLHVTATAAVNTAATATLPAAGAGLFHYITFIEVVKLYSVIGVAAGAGVIITTTNLPGNPAFTTEQLASPAGTVANVVKYTPATPLKSSVANTATTIVAPLQLQTIWRINVSYFTGV